MDIQTKSDVLIQIEAQFRAHILMRVQNKSAQVPVGKAFS